MIYDVYTFVGMAKGKNFCDLFFRKKHLVKMDYEKTGVIREMEIEKFNDLDKFGHFIDPTTFYHLK